MKITFIGHGYVGLVTASIFADLGNVVNVIGHTEEKIINLRQGILPIFEPGLEEIVKRNVKAKRLFFSLDYDSVTDADVVFIAVGTPPKKTGEADLSTVFHVAEVLAASLNGYTVVVTKSTVPVGTNKKIEELIGRKKPQKAEFNVASVPEFLREGSAIRDTLHPDRVVIGTESKKARDILIELHKPIDGQLVLTNLETAEMVKYASNSFLATKISFANAIARLSELTGADGVKVLEGMGFDRRIGKEFLYAGLGYGGSCFPKDVKALISISKNYGYEFKLLEEVEQINKDARFNIVKKTEEVAGNLKGKKIGVLGLAFKPDTDDMRDAPSIDIISAFKEKGASIKAYDPVAMENAKKIIKNIHFCDDIYETIEGVDILIVITEWNEFKEIDFNKIKNMMRGNIIIDGRNIYSPEIANKFGFIYVGVGR